jgi:hypothetical protein
VSADRALQSWLTYTVQELAVTLIGLGCIATIYGSAGHLAWRHVDDSALTKDQQSQVASFAKRLRWSGIATFAIGILLLIADHAR